MASRAAAAQLPSNRLELFVRAGIDGESYGACPVCQRIFMLLLVKAQAGVLNFTVTTVNMAKPPEEFKRLASRLPAVVHGSEVLADVDEMVQYLDERFPYPAMSLTHVPASQATQDVFSRFSFFIKDVSHSPQPLLTELARLNEFLSMSPHRFLCRDDLDHLDCLMLPKLQHIRVVCAAVKNLAIPREFEGFWRYMSEAYSHAVFRQTCPSDQEILHHWLNKPELSPLPKEQRNQLLSGQPHYSFDVPISKKA